MAEVDLSTPTEEAQDYIGLLDMYPDGSAEWVQETVDKIEEALDGGADVGGDENLNSDKYDSDAEILAQFSPEEQAAYSWYEDKIDHWDQTVAEWRQGVRDDLNDIKADPYSEADHYTIEGDKNFTPPDVKEYAGGKDAGKSQVVVSTEALEFFCDQIEKVAWDGGGVLWDARKAVIDVNLRPGRFARAERMRQKIAGASEKETGLRGDTIDVLGAAHEALFVLKQNIRAMIRDYNTTEEFNKLDAERLDNELRDAWGRIDELNDYGKSES